MSTKHSQFNEGAHHKLSTPPLNGLFQPLCHYICWIYITLKTWLCLILLYLFFVYLLYEATIKCTNTAIFFFLQVHCIVTIICTAGQKKNHTLSCSWFFNFIRTTFLLKCHNYFMFFLSINRYVDIQMLMKLVCMYPFQHVDMWSFNVFALNDASGDHALKFVFYDLLTRYDLINRFKVRQKTSIAFITQ